jgi:dimethylaniline monooxygenase (N-oxide forming)
MPLMSFAGVFSGFLFEEGLPMFLTNQQAHAYLLNYAKRFDLNEHVRLNSRVEMVSRVNDGGWLVESTMHGERREAEVFSHVIVASGRFNKPRIPRVKGFERFRGAILHTFDYRDNEELKDSRVLVIWQQH